MSHYNLMLSKRDFKMALAPYTIYCADSTCNLYIKEGTAVKYYDAATMTHIECPNFPSFNPAAHKNTKSDLWMGEKS